MQKKSSVLVSCFIAMALLFGSIHEAEAKRFGGGSSFGSKPSYSQPFQGGSSANTLSQASRSPAQQAATAQNQAARQGMSNRGGLMGMLGGLALGGLLGSMFFGGAFEHINIMDMLLFAGLAYLLYRVFASRSSRQEQPVANAYARNSYDNNSDSYAQPTATGRGFNTDVLFKGKNSGPVSIPAGFDQQHFLMGAENAFRHLQTAWDQRDLAAIRGLTTDKVFAEIQDQLRAAPNNNTEVLKVHAELLNIQEVGTELEATVLFDTLLKEDGAAAEQVKEVWHFVKPINSQQTKWFLDGIQQLQ